MITVNGRPHRKFAVSKTRIDGTLVIRLDDPADPEFWLEVTCDDAEMEELVVEFIDYIETTRVLLLCEPSAN